jgi:hypothetical protein
MIELAKRNRNVHGSGLFLSSTDNSRLTTDN